MKMFSTACTRPVRGRRMTGALVLALGAGLLAGCGQKGPLWISGHGKDTPWPMKPAGSDPPSPASPGDGASGAAPGAAAKNPQDAR